MIKTPIGTPVFTPKGELAYAPQAGKTGARWQLVPDIPGAKRPNSKRQMSKDQEWVDVVNHVRADSGDWNSCRASSELQARTVGQAKQAGNWPDESETRFVIIVSLSYFS